MVSNKGQEDQQIFKNATLTSVASCDTRSDAQQINPCSFKFIVKVNEI